MKHYGVDMLQIYAVNIQEALKSYDLEKELRFLDYYGEKKHRNYHFKEDLYRSVIGEIMVRTLLCQQCKLKNNQLGFFKNNYGKPYVKEIDNLYFNVSHSKDWVCITISNRETGIDIEEFKKDYVHLSAEYFNETESDYINNNMQDAPLKKFFVIWTLKESFVKLMGKGLSIPFNSFELIQDTKNPKLWYTFYNNSKYCFKVFDILQNYIVSISAPVKLTDERIHIMKFSDMIRDFHTVNT